MKRRLVVLSVILVLSVLLAGCNTSNKLKVGTSADYPPYEYVDETGKMTGFDVELMNEIGKRMGVDLEWVDMPFDSLIAAVQEGKIDLSIACFNYSAERDLEVDFSDAYYTSEDAFIAGAGFSGTFAKPEDAANYIVGVQSGTVQDDWLTSNLLDAGLMDADNLKRYERVDQAALDLNAGRIDIMMADYVPAKAILKQYTGFQVLYNGELSTGPLNIVLKDGDSELQGKINKIIKELLDEGFVDQLAVKYFSD
jgi:polar amino acid transport system substrate-binding protein